MDLRIIKTKKVINESFLELFNNQDFEKITVKDITENAQIGRKTFYLHYLDKYDLLDSIVDKKFEELNVICESKKALGLEEGTKIWLDYFENNKYFFNKLFKNQNANHYKKHLQMFIVDELRYKVNQEYILKKQLDYELFLQFFASGIIELITIFLTDENCQKENIEFQLVHLIKIFTSYSI